MGGALPAALLCAALGFMLAFAPARAFLPAAVLLIVAALATNMVAAHGPGLGAPGMKIAYVGCWASLILTCLTIHLPRGVPLAAALALALLGGCFAGAVIAGQERPTDLLRALPWILLCWPARRIVARGWQVAIKVVTSWMIAVALLAALLPTMVKTPGYVPDHMD
jgi:hypothetical protein